MKNIFAKNFGLRVCMTQNNLFDIEKHISIKEINSDKFWFKINPIVINADPFLFVKDEILYLFYEEQKTTFGKGVIKFIETTNLSDWSKPKVVLEENFHLSFPFVFRSGEDLYMIPETAENNSIRLYKPNIDLTKWTYFQTILSGHKYFDSSIIEYNSTFYLFTTIISANIYTLKLYFSDSLDNTWVEHPCSPICIGNKASRNGGSVIKYNNVLYRPAQNCEKIYGEKLAIYKINELTKTNYKEKLLYKDVFSKQIPFYSIGGHHFNHVIFQNEIIVASDALQCNYNIFEIWKRLIKTIKSNF
ncbi:MAG TPA: glycosyl transferase [Candidatus Paceibacterota bacterium]